MLWPPDTKSQLIRKDPDAGKIEDRREKGATEDEMGGWRHQLNGHEFEQSMGDSEVRESRCAAVHGHKESDEAEQLNNSNVGHRHGPKLI